MSIPSTSEELVECIVRSGVTEAQRLEAHLQTLRGSSAWPATAKGLAEILVRDGLLTSFQAEQFLLGKWKNFIIKGKYKLLERLGQGGMGTVFLCEHTTMRHAVALKLLPPEQAADPGILERFRREARAAAQLNHPNIVRTYDIDGRNWQPADDPQPGVHDGSTGGSPWPAFGDALAEKYRVPVRIASTGQGGTSVKQWEPDGELFNWMIQRMRQLGPRGFRAVLWHQGENDSGMSADEYARRLTTIIQGSSNALNGSLPWFVAQVSYRNGDNRSVAATRNAQKKVWETGVALEGPDTDTLTGDLRENNGQGIHFNAKGLRAHGLLWADKVGAVLDKVLQEK